MMAHVDLCSGIGGFALGFEWAGLSKPVLFCDIEPWSRKILAKHWPDVPIAEDVKELASDPRRLVPDCDILTAGYPCQPFSVAGKQRGEEDDRHIWPQIFTIVRAKRPNWCVFENVPGHINLGLNQVLSDLEDKAGYAVQTFVVPACAVNAPHRRDRLWIIAHANSQGEPDGTINEQRMVGNTSDDRRNWGATQAGRERAQDFTKQSQSGVRGKSGTSSQNVADTDSSRQQQSHKEMAGRSSEQFDSGSFQSREDVADTSSGQCKRGSQKQIYGQRNLSEQPRRGGEDAHRGWAVEPPVGRVAYGIPGRVDRLKGLGNAIVPQIAMQIGLTIKAVRDE
jgi:DNA (cytosine-5)-methyltransferase 1